jgi:hypothetical protein
MCLTPGKTEYVRTQKRRWMGAVLGCRLATRRLDYWAASFHKQPPNNHSKANNTLLLNLPRSYHLPYFYQLSCLTTTQHGTQDPQEGQERGERPGQESRQRRQAQQ